LTTRGLQNIGSCGLRLLGLDRILMEVHSISFPLKKICIVCGGSADECNWFQIRSTAPFLFLRSAVPDRDQPLHLQAFYGRRVSRSRPAARMELCQRFQRPLPNESHSVQPEPSLFEHGCQFRLLSLCHLNLLGTHMGVQLRERLQALPFMVG